MKKLIALAFLYSSLALCQGLVNITGTIQLADGSLANGTSTIGRQQFVTATGITGASCGSTNAVVVNGRCRASRWQYNSAFSKHWSQRLLVLSYQILYNILTLRLSVKYLWYVPATSFCYINEIQFPPPGLVGTTAIVSPAQLTQAGASLNSALCWNGAFWAPGNCGGGGGGAINAVNGTTNQISAVTSSGTVTLSLPSSILLPGALTAPTGSSITFSGSGTINANLINGVTLSSLGNGPLFNTTTTGAPRIALYSDIVNLWSSCTGTNYLQSNGTCTSPSGSGTVTSFSVTSVPSWLTSSVATATSTPALTISAASAQTSHQVIGTCGTATSFAPCALVSGDLPTISGSNFANFPAHTYFGNNSGSSASAQPHNIGSSDTTPYIFNFDTGSANAYVVCPSANVTSFIAGTTVTFTTTHANTGASTLTVCSLSTENLVKQGATALITGDILSGAMYTAISDGTNWQLANPSTASGGSGATMASQLGDFAVSITTANTVLTIGPNCSATTPCNIFLRDGVSGPNVISFTSPATATISAGSPLAYIYVDSSGNLSVGVASGTVVCSGCTTTAVSAFPASSVPIWTWSASSGAWVVSGGTDKRGWLLNNPDATPGTCMTGAGNTLSFDPTCATTLTSSNVTMPVANSSSTGTTLHKLAIINTSGQAVIATTSNTSVPVFIVNAGAGTTGSAALAIAGQFACTTDSGGATAGDFIVASATTGGECSDAGATAPTSGWVIGLAQTTVSGGATTNVLLAPGYNAASGGSTPACVTPFSRTCSHVSDDFYPAQYYGIGALGWQSQSVQGSGIAGPTNGENGHPGVIVSYTTSTSGDTTAFNLNSNNTGGAKWLWLGSTANMSSWETEFVIKTDDNCNCATSTALELGFLDSNTYRTGNGITLRFDTTSQTCTSGTNSTTNWVFETLASGSTTCGDTGVSVSGASWYTFKIISTSLGTVLGSVSSNGGAFSSPVTISTNVPTSAMFPQFLVMTRTAAPRRFSIDYWELEMQGLVR